MKMMFHIRYIGRKEVNTSQHGFRHGRLSLSAILDDHDQMLNLLLCNPRSSIDMVYLDFAKAFDKVDHRVTLF